MLQALVTHRRLHVVEMESKLENQTENRVQDLAWVFHALHRVEAFGGKNQTGYVQAYQQLDRGLTRKQSVYNKVYQLPLYWLLYFPLWLRMPPVMAVKST